LIINLVFSLFQGSSCTGTSFWLEWRPAGFQASSTSYLRHTLCQPYDLPGAGTVACAGQYYYPSDG
jgi:hypothetical protein